MFQCITDLGLDGDFSGQINLPANVDEGNQLSFGPSQNHPQDHLFEAGALGCRLCTMPGVVPRRLDQLWLVSRTVHRACSSDH